MEIQKKIFDRLLTLIPGGVFGLLTCAISLTGDTISIILFPGGYSFLENMISELGRGPSGIFFNLGLIISGILSFPYYIALYRSFDKETVNPIVRKSSLIFSLIIIVFLPPSPTLKSTLYPPYRNYSKVYRYPFIYKYG